MPHMETPDIKPEQRSRDTSKHLSVPVDVAGKPTNQQPVAFETSVRELSHLEASEKSRSQTSFKHDASSHQELELLKETHVANDGFSIPKRFRKWPKAGIGVIKLIPKLPRFKPLDTRLYSARVPSQSGSNDAFIPHKELQELVCKGTVIGELKRHKFPGTQRLSRRKTNAEVKKLAAQICGSGSPQQRSAKAEIVTKDSSHSMAGCYIKTFAILVLVRKSPTIGSFIDSGFDDSRLPITESACFQLNDERIVKAANPAHLGCFEGWEEHDVQEFIKNQWLVLAPVFTQSGDKFMLPQELHKNTVMPFVRWKRHVRGGFGQVFEVKIHPSHHDFKMYKKFAIKKLHSADEGDFLREVHILRKLSQNNHKHPHLIQLLATYKWGNEYYLMFPWAKSDLMDYWKDQNPNPQNGYDTAMWLAEQCCGLARALNKVHRYLTSSQSSMTNLVTSRVSRPGPSNVVIAEFEDVGNITMYGHHCDIKPENILWFPKEGRRRYGTLKISDFGIAHFDTRREVLAQERGVVPNSNTYRAPECHQTPWTLKTSYDVWTLGCLYLEFVTWYLGGKRLLREYSEKRRKKDMYCTLPWNAEGLNSDTFFVILKDESGAFHPEVKEEVTKTFDDLKDLACRKLSASYSGFFNDFLELIRQKMLIIEREGATEETGARISSNSVATKIDELGRKHFKNWVGTKEKD